MFHSSLIFGSRSTKPMGTEFKAFAQLKAWFRKKYQPAESMPFDEFLSLGLELVKDSARNHFARSRIGVPIRDGDDEDYYYD